MLFSVVIAISLFIFILFLLFFEFFSILWQFIPPRLGRQNSDEGLIKFSSFDCNYLICLARS